MPEWNLKEYKKMIYHHMLEEVMYHEDDIDTLREKLVEKQRNHKLDEREINRLFGEEVDTKYMREFWEARVQTHKLNEGMTNLEDDAELLKLKLQQERPKMRKYINPNKKMIMLDLGSGYGTWTFEFANNVKLIHAVDYIKDMADIGNKQAEKNNIKNVEFFNKSIQNFTSPIKYDTVLLSGVCIYQNDSDMKKIIERIKGYTKVDTKLIVRDSTGINNRYVIEKEYSERLGTMYSAIYRTREEYTKMFAKAGFVLIKDEDMFEEGSPLNKYKETRLRIYEFVRLRV